MGGAGGGGGGRVWEKVEVAKERRGRRKQG